MRQTMTSSAGIKRGRLAPITSSFAACSVIVLFAGPAMALDHCAAYGPDFTSVEGTSACVKIAGHVRVEIGSRGLGRVGDNGFAQQGAAAPAAMHTEETIGGEPGDFQVSHHLRLQQDSDPSYSGWYVR